LKAEDNQNSYTTQYNIDIGQLGIAVLTENPSSFGVDAARREAFTVSFSGLKAEMEVIPVKGRRMDRRIDFKIADALVGLQHQERDVVLVNLSQPFLKLSSKQSDISMLDVHVSPIDLEFGELEVSVTDVTMAQARLLAHNLAPNAAGLTFAEIHTRATTPYHTLRKEPPPASSKLVVSNLNVGVLTLSAWCRIHLPDAHYIPKSLRENIQMVNFLNPRLDVKGAQVKVPRQQLFNADAPAEGSFSAILSRVSDHYLPHVKASWRSLLQNSNIVMGGILARHSWAPRERREVDVQRPICHFSTSGELFATPPQVPSQPTSIVGPTPSRDPLTSFFRRSFTTLSNDWSSPSSMLGLDNRPRRQGPSFSM